MKPKVYLETTVASNLTAWPSRDIVMAANQEVTREWWTNRQDAFDLFVSQTVIQESSAGDSDAAQRRLEVLRQFPRLDITEEVEALAAALLVGIPASQGAGRCPAHCSLGRERNELLAHVELQSHRQRDPAVANRSRLPVDGL